MWPCADSTLRASVGVRSPKCLSSDLPRTARLGSFRDFRVPARFRPRDIARSGLRGLGYCVLELDAHGGPFIASAHRYLWPPVALKGEILGLIKGNLPADSERPACACFVSHQCPAQGIPGLLGLCAYGPAPLPHQSLFLYLRVTCSALNNAEKSRRFE